MAEPDWFELARNDLTGILAGLQFGGVAPHRVSSRPVVVLPGFGTMKPLWQIVLLAVWINAAETARWMLYTKPRFDAHYRSMGLELPNKPVNGMLWIVWGVTIAVIVFMLARKFSLWQTTLITWLAVFVLVWIALWNSAVLPLEILPVVVPLSLLTLFIAALIAKALRPHASA